MAEKSMQAHLTDKGFVQLNKTNLHAFAENMGSAYVGYPLFDWAFDRKCNPADMTKFFTVTFKTMMHSSLTFATSDRAESLISLIEPGVGVTTTWDYIKAGGISLYLTIGPKRIHRIEAYEAYSESLRKKYCTGDCWYFYDFTTRSEYQGKGMGRPLWSSVMEWLDENDKTIYLETAKQQNVETYGRYGFELLETGEVPGSGVPHYCMKRLPKGGK